MPGTSSNKSAAKLTASVKAENLIESHKDSLSGSARPGASPGVSSRSATSVSSSKKYPATIKDMGGFRNTRPTKSPTPFSHDNAVAAQGWAGVAPATISL